jgi:hypothetical protein
LCIVRGVAVEPLGQAEVGHVGIVVLVDQDVGRFQVAVQNSLLVGILQCLGHGQHDACSLAAGQRPGSQPPGQRLALHVLHAEVILAIDVADLVHGGNVAVVQARRGLGLDEKALQIFRRSEPAAQDHFQGDNPVELLLLGPVNHSHAAPAHFGEQFIIAEFSLHRNQRGRVLRTRQNGGRIGDRMRRRHKSAGRQGRFIMRIVGGHIRAGHTSYLLAKVWQYGSRINPRFPVSRDAEAWRSGARDAKALRCADSASRLTAKPLAAFGEAKLIPVKFFAAPALFFYGLNAKRGHSSFLAPIE